MIYEALSVLWGSLPPTKEDLQKKHFTNFGDAEIYGRICEIAKSYKKILNYAEECDRNSTVINYALQDENEEDETEEKYEDNKDNKEEKKEYEEEDNIGLYTRVLSEGLTNSLQPYLETLLEVEELITRNETLTLLFVYSYVEKYRSLFNALNRIIKTITARNLVGCQILSAIHQNILCGDQMVHDAVMKIYTALNRVFVTQISFWILSGDIHDPYDEFFICQSNKEISSQETAMREKASENTSNSVVSSPSGTDPFDTTELVTTLQNTSLDTEFTLNPMMIPYFLPLSLAQDILFIGKTVTLFGDEPRRKKKANGVVEIQFSIWEDREKEFHEKVNNLRKEESFEGHNLRLVIKEIKECITKHLWSAAVEEAQLLHELRLMKDFFLLGRGELFLEWLRLAAHHLDAPPSKTVSKDLNQAFQLAARAVFLGNCPDVKKFSFETPTARSLQAAANTTAASVDDSSTVFDGWSTIVLKYKIKWPLHLLFTPEVLARYNDLFRLLLRIKKTQHDLHLLWKTFKKSTKFGMCQMHNKLMFLMDNLQHYLQADVLESNFATLSAAAAAEDFEALRRAHAHYLADTLSQSFITVAAPSSDASHDTSDSISNPVFSNLMELLKLCDSFCEMSATNEDRDLQDYYLIGYTERYNKLVGQLMQLLSSLQERGCGRHLARLLMRLDYNRWLSANTL